MSTLEQEIRDLRRRVTALEGLELPTLYAEGTYTPTYLGSTVPGATGYTLQQGWYWKVGHAILVTGLIVWVSATGTGDAHISLPFTPSASAGFRATVNARLVNVTFSGSFQGIVATTASYFTLESPVSNAASVAIAVEAAGNISFSCFYGVD